VPAEREARARFLAALYTRHWIESDAPAPAFPYWLGAALEAAPEAEEMMRGYASTRAEPVPALLFSARQQGMFTSGERSERHIWTAPHLDPEGLRGIAAVLEARGAGAAGLEDSLLRHHAVGARPVNLLHAAYHWGLTDQPRANSSTRHAPPAFYSARAPRVHFCLVAAGDRPLELELVARLPRLAGDRTGRLGLALEGRALAEVPLDTRWTRHVVRVDAAALRRGINRLTLRWPLPPPEGDAVLARIGARLDQRVGVDVRPVLGHVMELRARTP
jgi:hypothetical protein